MIASYFLAQSAFSENAAAVVSLLWVAIAGYTAWKLIPRVAEIIDKRDVYVEVGGMKIKLEKVVEQFQKQLSGLTAEAVSHATPVRQAMANESKDISPTATGRATTVGQRILWVDDNPGNNALYIRQLREAGIDVITAKSTCEALDRLQTITFAAIISDCGRAEETGFSPAAGIELARIVREEYAETPFILFSNNDALTYHASAIASANMLGATNSPIELFKLLQGIGLSLR